jgi:hypothetical protein
MILYIMSRGRAGKVNTLKWIPKGWQSRTTLLVPREEYGAYERLHGKDCIVASVPQYVKNYSQKVQWILDGCPTSGRTDLNDKAVILDDDLVFSKRSNPDRPDSLVTVTDKEQLHENFIQMEMQLDRYALVGVHPRQMGQNAARPYVLNGRIICIQGINRRLIGQVQVDQYPILADVVLNCTLLARGQPNAILTTFFQDHGPCQAPGGCSIYRTPEMQRVAVQYLVRRFPGFVKEVERRPKVAKWMGDVRYDYTCQWKKLYAAGVAWREHRGPCPDREHMAESNMASIEFRELQKTLEGYE